MRRRYTSGLACDDCGRRYATRVHFWVNGMPYNVCPDCIRAYRPRLLDPCPHWQRPKRRDEPNGSVTLCIHSKDVTV